jgi:hypothetical protein
MSNAKNLVAKSNLRQEIPLENIKDNKQTSAMMFVLVSIKLVSCPPIPVAWHTRCAERLAVRAIKHLRRV